MKTRLIKIYAKHELFEVKSADFIVFQDWIDIVFYEDYDGTKSELKKVLKTSQGQQLLIKQLLETAEQKLDIDDNFVNIVKRSYVKNHQDSVQNVDEVTYQQMIQELKEYIEFAVEAENYSVTIL